MNFIKGLLHLAAISLVLATSNSNGAESIEELMFNGNDLLRQGAYDQAITQFRKVLSKEPTMFEAQFNLGFSYLQSGRHSNAVTELKKALVFQPRNSEIISNLAIAYENMGDRELALSTLLESVKLDPSNVSARINLAVMYVNAQKFETAITHFTEALSYDHENVGIAIDLARCLVAVNRINDAKSYLNKAIASNQDNSEAHAELGSIIWKKEKDLTQAIAEYRSAVALEPTSALFHENLALILTEHGNMQESLDSWKNALIYTEDELKKESIRENINRIEAAKNQPSESELQKTALDNIVELKKELRIVDTSRTKVVEVAPVNVMDDLDELSNHSGTVIDLRGEAKKRAGSQ